MEVDVAAENGMARTPTQKQVTFNDTLEIAELNIDLRTQLGDTTSELSLGLGATSPSKLKAAEKDRHSKTGRRGLPKKG